MSNHFSTRQAGARVGGKEIVFTLCDVYIPEMLHGKLKKKVFMVRASSRYTELNLIQRITVESKQDGLDRINTFVNTPLGNSRLF